MCYFEGCYVYGDTVYVNDHYMDERWTYIRGFNNYLISDKARVWSVKSKCFIKPKPMDNHGHLGVCLRENGKNHYRYLHRLVAEAFIPNPNNHPIVRHTNDVPSWNEAEELTWGTQKDNHRDCVRNGNCYYPTDEDRYKGNKDRMTAIIATNIYTKESMRFESQGQAARFLGVPQANIWKVLNGQRPKAGEYIFEYEEESAICR